MRIAHATDIHWFVPPPLRRLPGKRSLGTAMLYGRGRRHHFDVAVQTALVQALVDVEPDVVLISGDLTAQALPEEFALAREALDPVLSALPTFMQHGNHDVYTGGSKRSGRMSKTFGAWMHLDQGPVARMDLGPLTILGLDPCRPHWSASGRVPPDQLHALRTLLDDPAMDERTIVLSQHYPVVNARGELYDNAYHGLRNADALQAVLREVRNRPAAIVHGHKHHGYQSAVPLGGSVPDVMTINPGSSGYAHDPAKDRMAHFNVYTVQDGEVVDITRHRHDGSGFVPLDGDPYP